jgi:toxin-antitoxin system PIN domain toxin
MKMIIPDVNLLIYAYNRESPVHIEARAWWERTVAGPRLVGLCWVVILGFIRILTKRSAVQNPVKLADVLADVRSWMDAPNVVMIGPGSEHAKTLFALLEAAGVAGDLTTDAHLAALAIEYQAEVASTDTDFARFQGLRWFNPLKV